MSASQVETNSRLTAALKVDPEDPFSDFRKFLFIAFTEHLNLPPPTPVQLDIAYYLQHGPRRQIIQAFRGVGKSWITSLFVVWLLFRDPQLNILVVSASKDRADAFSTFTQRVILEWDILEHLRPRKNQRFAKHGFDVGPATASQAPSVKSVGVKGQMTGGRADVIIPDDVEVPSNSMTQALREGLGEIVKEFDAILKPGGHIKYLGTPQVEQTLYNKLLQRGYSTRIWPSRYPLEDAVAKYGARLAPIIIAALKLDPGLATAFAGIGKTTDPQRFSDYELAEKELSYGRSGYALQFQLDTSLSDFDRHPLRVSDLVIMPCDIKLAPENVVWAAGKQTRLDDDLPNAAMDGDYFHGPMATPGKYLPYQGAILAVDPSGRGSDETSYSVTKFLNGNIFTPECGGVAGGYGDSTMTALAMIAKKHNVTKVIVESNFGDGMFTELLKPYLRKIHNCTVEEIRHNIQKEKRIIDTLEPVMNQHRLIVDPSVIQRDFESVEDLPEEKKQDYMLVYQMTRITKDPGALVHDDRLDVLAMGVAYWVKEMGLDQATEMEEREAEEREEHIRRTIADALSTNPNTIVFNGHFGSEIDMEDGWDDGQGFLYN